MLQQIITLVSMFSSAFNILSFALTATGNSSEFLFCEVLCGCHLLWDIFTLFITVTFLIYINEFAFMKFFWLCIWSLGSLSTVQSLQQQGQHPSDLCLQVHHLCLIQISLPIISPFFSLQNLHFCWQISNFRYQYLYLVTWFQH